MLSYYRMKSLMVMSMNLNGLLTHYLNEIDCVNIGNEIDFVTKI